MKTAVLAQLRTLIKSQTHKEVLSFSALNSGVPLGAITEISGLGKTQATVQLLAEHPHCQVAWLEESFSIFPYAFLQHQVELERILFIETGKHLHWSALQVLKSQFFKIVVLYAQHLELNALRKLQLASEKAQVAIIWLSNESKLMYPIHLQLQAKKRGSKVDLQVLRKKF